jgi:hypothetical protein
VVGVNRSAPPPPGSRAPTAFPRPRHKTLKRRLASHAEAPSSGTAGRGIPTTTTNVPIDTRCSGLGFCVERTGNLPCPPHRASTPAPQCHIHRPPQTHTKRHTRARGWDRRRMFFVLTRSILTCESRRQWCWCRCAVVSVRRYTDASEGVNKNWQRQRTTTENKKRGSSFGLFSLLSRVLLEARAKSAYGGERLWSAMPEVAVGGGPKTEAKWSGSACKRKAPRYCLVFNQLRFLMTKGRQWSGAVVGKVNEWGQAVGGSLY